jgi:hypothetical protein
MSHKRLTALAGLALVAIQFTAPPTASAVGNGVPFGFREGLIPNAQIHPVLADSMDFTYHSCFNFTDMDSFTETGYLWISSFQDVAGVVDSQINHFLPNGYHLYARYTFQGDECSSEHACNGGTRRNYAIDQARIALFIDPAQDTVLSIQNCAVAVANNGDDGFLGFADNILSGQKSETNEQANGDFDIVFNNWAFTALGQTLFLDVNGAPLAVPTLVFNANVTILGGPLNQDHRPEGSGNLYWVD